MSATDISPYLSWRDRFAVAMDARLYTLEYLDYIATQGRGQFWSTDEAAIIAEVKTYPTGARVIHGLIAAGDLNEIVKTLIPTAEEWARKQGCMFAIIESREGWVRELKDSGYEVYQTCVRKVL
jgi:hypothetical protein